MTDRIQELEHEVRALKDDQEDWRKGVAYIAASAGMDTLACTWIANRVLETRAELEETRGKLWEALEVKARELEELREAHREKEILWTLQVQSLNRRLLTAARR